jgi:hypothetical protein
MLSGASKTLPSGAIAYSARPPWASCVIATTRAPDPRVAARARRVHDTADVHPEREGRRHRDRGDATVATVDVVEVERSRGDANAQLPGAGLRHGDLRDLAHLARRTVAQYS